MYGWVGDWTKSITNISFLKDLRVIPTACYVKPLSLCNLCTHTNHSTAVRAVGVNHHIVILLSTIYYYS